MTSNVCVIGCGHWGKNLVRTFSEIGSLYGVFDASNETTARFTATYPLARGYETYGQVLEDRAVHAVAIATPAEMHCDMALAAFAAGKHVLVEKPLALEWHDGVRMVEAAWRARRTLMVGHLLHYHPAIVHLKRLISNGDLGKIEYIYSNRVSMGKIRREENALWSFAPHDISVILSLVGESPFQVTATGGTYLQPNIADVTMSNLLFNRGTRAHIFVSWLHPYKEQKLVVIGSRQMAVFEDSRPDRKLMLFSKKVELRPGGLEAAKPEGVVIDIPATEPLRAECEHFLECVESGALPRTSGEEGVRVLQVLQACQRSLQLNGEPVQVNDVRQKVMAM